MPPARPRAGWAGPAACLALAALLLLCPGPAQALDKVRVRLQWVDQAQFAGFYLAQDRGLYRQAGLEVELLPANPLGQPPLEELAQGGCDFATAWLSQALIQCSQGARVVNLAQLSQRSAMALVVWADSGITNPAQLAGRRVSLWQSHFAAPCRALCKRLGIEVREVNQNASLAAFMNHAVDACSAMLYNEVHVLYQAGVDPDEVRVFELASQGVDLPEDGIYAAQETWERRPELCRRFVAATLAGWRLALEEPGPALDAVMRRVDALRLASNRAHQAWMLKIVGQNLTHRVGLEGLGRQDLGAIAQAEAMLREQGLLAAPVEPGQLAVPAWQAEPAPQAEPAGQAAP